MPDLELDLLSTARKHYQEGQLVEAESLYHGVLEHGNDYSEAQYIEALSWLGLIADQLGKLEESVAYQEDILALCPHSAEAHSNLAAVLCKQGRLQEAIAHQQQALALKPDDPESYYNLGIVLYENGQPETAIVRYRQAIALNARHANAHHNLGIALYRQEKFGEAIAHYRQAVTSNPNHASAHNSLGVALFQQGQMEESLIHYRQAIALKPDYANAHNNLGTVLQYQGKLDEAFSHYQRALEINPNYANAYDNLGTILQERGQLATAIEHYERAIALDPKAANAYNNLGAALKEQNKVEEAIACCQKALALQPDHADAHNNLGSSLVEQADFEGAIAHFEQAIRSKPDHANAHLNLGIILLLLGDFQRGFVEYHWRWRTKQCPNLRYPQALWDGTDLNGKLILLTAEQGFGDTLQFVRYATLVASRGGRVVVACQQPLLRLLATVPGVERCVNRDQENVEIHVHTPMLDVPMLLGTTLDTIPAMVPYLTPTATPVALATFPETQLKVGIVWAVNPDSSTAPKRSCPLSYFLALREVPGIALYSLQKAPPETDQPLLHNQNRLQDLHNQMDDFADTAAAIAQLDLVISVDTAVAHLAGALGKPVWTLLANVADWRWLRDRDDTPWYPTMRLFRQPAPDDWASVFTQVTVALQEIGDRLQSGETLTAIFPPPPKPEQSPTLPTLPHVPTLPTSPTPLSPPSSLPGFNQLKPCRHGILLYNRNDFYIGRSLDLYGEWSEGEVTLFQALLRPNDTVIEVGANIGSHTVFFANMVGAQGNVVAIEPQRVVFQTLCANLALNSLTNTYCYQLGLGDDPGFGTLPVLDYNQTNNFGGISLTKSPPLLSAAGKTPADAPPVGERVQIVTLDSFGVQFCRLLKIDVEGMELQVLKGGTETIQRCQPILYLENDRQEQSAGLIRYLQSLGYTLYWHRPTLYNPQNFNQNPENVFGNTISVNMLGIHPSHNIVIEGMEEVTLNE